MVTRDPVPELQFRDEEADTRIVLYARHARRNDSVMHSDTLTLRLMSLSYCLLIANTTLKRCYMKKARGANTLCIF